MAMQPYTTTATAQPQQQQLRPCLTSLASSLAATSCGRLRLARWQERERTMMGMKPSLGGSRGAGGSSGGAGLPKGTKG